MFDQMSVVVLRRCLISSAPVSIFQRVQYTCPTGDRMLGMQEAGHPMVAIYTIEVVGTWVQETEVGEMAVLQTEVLVTGGLQTGVSETKVGEMGVLATKVAGMGVLATKVVGMDALGSMAGLTTWATVGTLTGRSLEVNSLRAVSVHCELGPRIVTM